jgi:hypothetical protein
MAVVVVGMYDQYLPAMRAAFLQVLHAGRTYVIPAHTAMVTMIGINIEGGH